MESMQKKNNMKPKLEVSWLEILKDEFNKEYFIKLKENLLIEKENYNIYPPNDLIFNAFNLTPFNQVKVIILAQDPYIRQGQAMGLSFSIPKGVKYPPSLKNIFKELKNDLDIDIPANGDLTQWSKEGVLLLNSILTVRARESMSHKDLGWEIFTDQIIRKLSKYKKNLIFVLWGKKAQKKKELIDDSKHLILEANHPSPFSAYYGFFNCKHFSKINEYLSKTNQKSINWKL